MYLKKYHSTDQCARAGSYARTGDFNASRRHAVVLMFKNIILGVRTEPSALLEVPCRQCSFWYDMFSPLGGQGPPPRSPPGGPPEGYSPIPICITCKVGPKVRFAPLYHTLYNIAETGKLSSVQPLRTRKTQNLIFLRRPSVSLSPSSSRLSSLLGG